MTDFGKESNELEVTQTLAATIGRGRIASAALIELGNNPFVHLIVCRWYARSPKAKQRFEKWESLAMSGVPQRIDKKHMDVAHQRLSFSWLLPL